MWHRPEAASADEARHVPPARLRPEASQEIELVPETSDHCELQPAEARLPRRRCRRRAWLALAGITVSLAAMGGGLAADHGAMLRRVLGSRRLLIREDLSMADYPLARCNDGSAGAFYFSEADESALAGGEAPNANWLVMLQGGFQCYSEESCACRASTSPDLMSSMRWPDSLGAEGVALQLTGWNVAWVGYCSSDAWLGDGSAQLPLRGTLANASEGEPLHFGGRAILEATLGTLAAAHGMGGAARVLLGGCSAGGRGALYNLDHACELVARLADGPRRDAPRCEGLIDAGWWHDAEPIASQRQRGVPSLAEVAEASFALYAPSAARQQPDGGSERREGLGGVCGRCAWEALSKGEPPGACLLGGACAAHVSSRFLLVQSLFDAFALSMLQGAPPPALAAQAANEWAANGTRGEAAVAQRDASRAQWTAAHEGGGSLSGLFGSSCFTHCMSGSDDWFRTKVGGRTAAELLESWLDSGSEFALEECEEGLAGGLGCSEECALTPVNNSCSCVVGGAADAAEPAERSEGDADPRAASCPWSYA